MAEPTSDTTDDAVSISYLVVRPAHDGASFDPTSHPLIRAEITTEQKEDVMMVQPNTYQRLTRKNGSERMYIVPYHVGTETMWQVQWRKKKPDDALEIASFHFQPHLEQIDVHHVRCTYYISCIRKDTGERLFFSVRENKDVWYVQSGGTGASPFLVHHLARPDNDGCFGPERGFDPLHEDGHLSLLEMSHQQKQQQVRPARPKSGKGPRSGSASPAGGDKKQKKNTRVPRRSFVPEKWYNDLKKVHDEYNKKKSNPPEEKKDEKDQKKN